jgi:succinate-semialdehyde dehydrogenase / glutarate-semialdehyde dehydrogenase
MQNCQRKKTMSLANQKLLRNTAFIDGQWISAENNATFIVTNPADGREIITVANMGASETRTAIEAANKAWPAWRALTGKQRSVILRRWFELIMENMEDLARFISLEQGKPMPESLGEVAYGASFVEWFAEEAKRIYGDTIPGHAPDKRIVVIKQPIGVVAAITPWNFPIAMITRKCAPALAVGCPVIIKPAPDTPLSALALAHLAEEAGFPAGIFNVLPTTRTEEVGEILTSSPVVRKLSFTGSTRVGQLLMRQCSNTIKKLSLELGGNAPFIVFDDANLDEAVAGAMISKYRNTGQTCVCANRLLVQSGIYDAFVKKLTESVEALKVGPALSGDVTQGPLINDNALTKVKEHIEDAVAKGARIVTGGKPHKLGGTFFQPTILADVSTKMKLAQEETFGPVAPVFKFETEQEAIDLANDTEVGLAAYFYSENMRRIWRVAEALEVGMVGINDGLISTEVAPFGGVKMSGLGREGSKYGCDEFLEMKYLCFGGI